MSVEAMTMVNVAGPENMVDSAIGRFLAGGNFHPENAVSMMAGTKKLLPFDSSNPYAELLSKTLGLMKDFGIEPEFHEFSFAALEVEEVSQKLEELQKKSSSLKAEREEKEKTVQSSQVMSQQLGHFASFDVELSNLFNMRYLKFRFGRIPEESHREMTERLDDRPDAYWFDSGRAGHWMYGGYFVLPGNYSRVDSMCDSMGFERIHVEVDGNLESTANQTMERLAAEKKSAELRIAEIDVEQKSLISTSAQPLLLYYSWLKYMSGIRQLRSYAGQRHGKFYLVGWMPYADAKEVEAQCEKLDGFSCILTNPKDRRELHPPVKLKKGFFSGIYEPFVEMYGLPAYGELDPRLFLAITYTVLFGVMFGDVGQGAMLVVIGLLLWKLKNMWLGRIVALCGVSAALMGLVYGSVFGNEHILPGFKVLEDGNTMKILIVAVGVGVVLILICMVMNVVTGIRQRDIKKIFFEPNGIAGFVLYLGIAAGAVLKLVGGINLFTPLYIIFVIALPIFLILAATPLTKLLTGQKDWMPKSIGMFLVEGFFELFETALSYVSNTVSFLRVGAFAISHAGMMMVVYLLSSGADGYSIGGLIFGNLLVTGIETVLVCIQVMRLEFYEMFGRFYKGGGVKFSPKVIDYSQAQ